MTTSWLRRATLATACACSLLLAACGANTESALQPTRFIGFGDAFSSLGPSDMYTLNDGSTNRIWTQHLAASFGLTLAAAPDGLGYAQGNARIVVKPDAAGNNGTRTLKEQIDDFLAANTLREGDVVVLGGGMADVVAEVSAYRANQQTEAQMLGNIRAAGRELGAQVRRLTQAGGTHVLASGIYDLGTSPWARASGQTELLHTAASEFNKALLISIADLGNFVLYLDAAYYFNLVTATPKTYDFDNATEAVCTSRDPDNGIGIGRNEVNSAKCLSTTIVAGADYSRYVFADSLYPTPKAQRQYGGFVYNKLRARW